MPIYEYRCSGCGHQQEFLQKVSDAPLSVCTACGQPTFSKLLTAAGFQLKGSGWYATDFKSKPSAPGKAEARPETKAETGGSDKPAAESKSESSGSGHACGSGGCGACS